jgi:hypothetical protein
MTKKGCLALVGEDPQIRVIEEEFSINKGAIRKEFMSKENNEENEWLFLSFFFWKILNIFRIREK